MSTSRRSFIKKGSLVLVGSAIFSKEILAASKPKTLTGVQLYSVRDDMGKDPLGTLKQSNSRENSDQSGCRPEGEESGR